MRKVRIRDRLWLTWLMAVCVTAGAAGPEVFSVHDLNRDGYLDRAEYERMRAECLAKRSGRGHRPCALEFSVMDADGDGRIGEQELIAALERAPGRYRYRGGAQPAPGEPNPAGGVQR
jgi:Ca2+-binding EF-hand superfamily protein